MLRETDRRSKNRYRNFFIMIALTLCFSRERPPVLRGTSAPKASESAGIRIRHASPPFKR